MLTETRNAVVEPRHDSAEHAVVVRVGDCACHSIPTTQVHHRDFPEIRAEAGSAAEGAHHLTHLLTRALDSAPSHWRRESIQQAIHDVAEFIRCFVHTEGCHNHAHHDESHEAQTVARHESERE